jgi:hypothetical protein
VERLTDCVHESESGDTNNHTSQPQPKTSQHSKLLRLPHLQLPHAANGQHHDHEIGRHIRQDQRLE